MTHRTTPIEQAALALSLLGSLSACSSDTPAGAANSSIPASSTVPPTGTNATATAQATASADAPFTVPLTTDRINASLNKAKPFDPWDAGKMRLEQFLGAPTKVEGKRVTWAVVVGDACTYTYIEKDDRSKYFAGQSGEMVGAYREPYTSTRADPQEDCFEAAGSPVFPDDPKAAPPPADGAATTVATVLDHAPRAPSLWEGKRVTIDGLLDRVDVFDGRGPTLHLIAKVGASDPYLRCELPVDEKAPPDPGAKAPPIRVEAKVHVARMRSSKGLELSAQLQECKLAAKGR